MDCRLVFGLQTRAARRLASPRCRSRVPCRCRAPYGRCREIFPLRGAQRDDVRRNLRITRYTRGSAFVVEAELVSIVGIFCGAQDYEAILQDNMEY